MSGFGPKRGTNLRILLILSRSRSSIAVVISDSLLSLKGVFEIDPAREPAFPEQYPRGSALNLIQGTAPKTFFTQLPCYGREEDLQ